MDFYRAVLLCVAAFVILEYVLYKGLRAPPAEDLDDVYENAGQWLLQDVEENGKEPCHLLNTTSVHLFGLPFPRDGQNLTLLTGEIHRFVLVSLDSQGARRCQGGDYFELELSSDRWMSRPPVTDRRDGSYLVELFVDDSFAGLYKLEATLMFTNFRGFSLFPLPVLTKVLTLSITFTNANMVKPLKLLPSCLKNDFTETEWKGRWMRTKMNGTLVRDGATTRFRALSDDEQCEPPWCEGPLGKLDSNGWVYSSHCAFHIWSESEAWQCLDGKRLLFWGDSNHQDTIRNLLNFVLNFNIQTLDRVFNATYRHPTDPSRSFEIRNLFNGHYNSAENFQGLNTVHNDDYRSRVQKTFTEGGSPHVVVLNSGLHDGQRWNSLGEFVEAARDASKLWSGLVRNSSTETKVIFRKTITVAGHARAMVFNNQKMDGFNQLFMGELLREFGPSLDIVDAFDLTYPWHWDLCCSDSIHYGRLEQWYFVDLMLVHILLNAICRT